MTLQIDKAIDVDVAAAQERKRFPHDGELCMRCEAGLINLDKCEECGCKVDDRDPPDDTYIPSWEE